MQDQKPIFAVQEAQYFTLREAPERLIKVGPNYKNDGWTFLSTVGYSRLETKRKRTRNQLETLKL